MKTFIDYLSEQFVSDTHITEDNYEAELDGWMSNLDPQEIIDYAQAWKEEQDKDLKHKILMWGVGIDCVSQVVEHSGAVKELKKIYEEINLIK